MADLFYDLVDGLQPRTVSPPELGRCLRFGSLHDDRNQVMRIDGFGEKSKRTQTHSFDGIGD